MHGYAALLGFGITRIKNQMVDPIPTMKNASFVLVNDPKNFLNLRIIILGLEVVTKIAFYKAGTSKMIKI